MERSDIKDLRPYRPVGSGSAGVRRRLMAEFQSTLERRLGEQREAWKREDSQLRLAMGAGAGVDLGQMISALGLGSHRMEDLEAFAHGGRMSARYDTALTTDENRAHWSMADALAVDAANSPMVRYTLRNRARYEVANNGYARGVGRSIANDFCGTGPRLHVDDDRLSESEQEDLENKFNSWADLIDLPGKLRTMRKARRQDGEAFACLITNPNLDHPVKLDLKLIETDQVRFVDIALLTVPSVDGIRYDDYGNPVSYHILRVHPGFWSYATGYIGMPWEYDVWQARYVIHWFEEDRPSQHRGLPELLPALPLYAILRRYTLATATAAETAADFSVLLETQAGAIPAETAADLTAFSTAALRRNLMVALPDGYTAKQMAAEHPNTTFPMFRKEILGEIGRAESVPYPIISGSAQDSNMASGQLDHKIYFGDREIERGDADRKILNRVLREWIAEAALLEPARGQAPYLPQVLRKIGPALSHAWHWPSNELGDVMKLAAAKKTNLSDGLTDIPAEFARKGRSWLKSFRANARALGITFEEYQHLVRDSIFSAKQTLAPDDDTGGQSGVPKPNQGALQEALK